MSNLDHLFSLTSDELFQKYSISEIRLLQSNLDKEINKKKDELRVLVGEKYRDFMEIIDKISLMNDLADKFTKRIDGAASDISALNLNIRNKVTKKLNEKLQLENQAKNTVAVLIKLLMDIEDQIWCEIGECRFIISTMLLQLAVHIKTVLSLERSWQIDQQYPVVYESWNSILRFPIILTQMVEEKLKSNDLSVMMACECLCTATILENLDCVDVIRRFLALRMETLKHTFGVTDAFENVRVRILNSYKIVINTLEVLFHSFKNLSNDRGIFWSEIENITTPKSEPVLSFVKLGYIAVYGKEYIPNLVQNFRVKISKQVAPVDPKEYNEYIREWLSWVRNYSKEEIVKLLNLIGSLKTLHLLRESVPPLFNDWSLSMGHFSLTIDMNLWSELYEPLIIERAKALLLQQWNTVFGRICDELQSLIKEIHENRKKEPEDNLHWFLWESFEDDMQNQSESCNYSNIKSLTIKSMGLSPNAGRMCAFVESLVSNMINELGNISTENDFENEQSKVLKQHQQLCCVELLEKLMKHVEELATSSEATESVIIFLARFLSGISLLCLSLKQCILLLDDQGEKWSIVNVKLLEQSLSIWRKWSETISTNILAEFHSQIALLSSSTFRMKYFPKWDIVVTKEEGEDGISVDSEIKVPFQASFPIQHLLNILTAAVGRTLPPRAITIEITDYILSKVLVSLAELQPNLHQTIYVQFLFDVKYLSDLLISIENDKLNQQANETISKIECLIDPVDLDSVSSHLSENVRLFVYKTQTLFGLLINNKPRINIEQYSEKSNEPDIVFGGATNVAWFPLLPVSTIYPSSEKK